MMNDEKWTELQQAEDMTYFKADLCCYSPESVPLYPYEIITGLSTLGQLDYSAFPVPDTTLDDFSPEELQRLRDILS